MLELLKSWDADLFLALNGAHNSIFDFIMFWLSDKFIWIPLYLFFLYLLIKNYKWETIAVFLSILILITLSDQLSVHLFKEVFQRPRPCHEPDLFGMVHLINGKCGGQYGFISSHASNTFALAVFLIQFLGKRYRYFISGILIWAVLIGYSRIYLGVHYPGDVIVGAVLGSVLGLIISRIYIIGSVKFFKKNNAEL